MADAWGPWIEHDGTGCPCAGDYVIARVEDWPGEYRFCSGRASAMGEGWDWANWLKVDPADGLMSSRIVRYQVRKPRGLSILENLIANLPAPQPEGVDA